MNSTSFHLFPEWLLSLDLSLFYQINGHHSSVMDMVMFFLSYPGNILWAAIGVVVIWRLWMGSNRERVVIFSAVVAVLLADFICDDILKPFFQRPRPFDELIGITTWKRGHWVVTTSEYVSHVKNTLSFPSAHAINNWTLAVFIFCFYPRAGIPLMILASLVSYSRVYLGVHYPLDVLAGALFGAVIGMGAACLVKWCLKQMGEGISQGKP